MNKQREAIYKLRRDIFDGTEGRDYIVGVSKDILETLVATHCPEKTEPAEWTLSELVKEVLSYYDIDLHTRGLKLAEMTDREIAEEVWAMVEAKYLDKEQRLGPELLRMLERDVMLRYVDLAWKDHLLALDHLKEGIGLRGYGQRDPLQEYKKESYELFKALKERVEDTVIKTLFRQHPNVKLCLSGHVHLADEVTYLGVRYLCNGAVSGGWWKGPYQEFGPAYAVVDLFEDGSFDHHLEYYREPAKV